MKAYVDTSVVLWRVFRHPRHFPDLAMLHGLVVSELVEVEVRRSLERYGVRGIITPTEASQHLDLALMMLSMCKQVAINRRILRRAASSFGMPLGTLDAIHLATALAWMEDNDEDLTILTHDNEMAKAARWCGLAVRTGA